MTYGRKPVTSSLKEGSIDAGEVSDEELDEDYYVGIIDYIEVHYPDEIMTQDHEIYDRDIIVK